VASEAKAFSPPYTSFTTLLHAFDRMSGEGGVPERIDRSYLSNMPGGVQSPFIASLKSLGLVNEQLEPTETLVRLVEADEAGRKSIIRDLLHDRYQGPLALSPKATQQQLEEGFREYGISGSTLRKAVGFFLAAARFADVPTSPHFRLPKAQPGERRPNRRKEGSAQAAPTTTSATQPPVARELPVHPLIAGLLRELPEPGEEFPQEKQEDWIAIAKATFRLIYRSNDVARGSSSAANQPASS
jgi:Family of unknown function (DUF5343)